MGNYLTFNTTSINLYIRKSGKNQIHVPINQTSAMGLSFEPDTTYKIKGTEQGLIATIWTDINGIIRKVENHQKHLFVTVQFSGLFDLHGLEALKTIRMSHKNLTQNEQIPNIFISQRTKIQNIIGATVL